MTSDDVTPEQAARMRDKVGPMLAYLRQLMNRIDARHFPPNDRFRRAVQDAYSKMHSLNVELHYMSCAQGTVGRSPTSDSYKCAPSAVR